MVPVEHFYRDPNKSSYDLGCFIKGNCHSLSRHYFEIPYTPDSHETLLAIDPFHHKQSNRSPDRLMIFRIRN